MLYALSFAHSIGRSSVTIDLARVTCEVHFHEYSYRRIFSCTEIDENLLGYDYTAIAAEMSTIVKNLYTKGLMRVGTL